MAMGAGYAYWTDGIALTATVDTGNFNVKFVESHDYIDVYAENEGSVDGEPAEYVTTVVDPELGTVGGGEFTDTITVTFNNIYPGTWMRIPVEIKNLGSIPAVFDRAEVNFISMDGNTPIRLSYDELDDETKGYYGLLEIRSLYYKKVLYPSNRTQAGASISDVTFANLQSRLDSLLNNIMLLPNESLQVGNISSIEPAIKIALPSTVEDKDLCEKNLSVEIKLHWKQFNAQ